MYPAHSPYKKVIKRKPGTGESSYYFDMKAHEAIVEYQKEKQEEIRQDIYTKRILPAFSALVENLINNYGFQVSLESKTDLRNECLEFLYGVVDKFNPERGSKAFSYFNVVAKNWLTIRSKQNAKNIQIFVSIDDRDSISTRERELIENYHVIPSCDEVEEHEYIVDNVHDMLCELEFDTKTENERICLEAIKALFASMETIDIVNKRAVMAYLRELTNLTSKQLSITLASFRKYYKEYKDIVREDG